jgi:hypothetical protein
MTTLTPTGHPLADAITALEAVAASACDPEHTIDDLAGLLRAVEDVKKRAGIVADVLGQALLVHVKWRRPGRETVRFETTKPPTAPTEPAGAEQ